MYVRTYRLKPLPSYQDYLGHWGFPCGASGKEPTCQCRSHKRPGFDPWVGKITWRRKWQPIPVFLPGEFHGQRSLVGFSPWDGRVRHDLATNPHFCECSPRNSTSSHYKDQIEIPSCFSQKEGKNIVFSLIRPAL